MDTDNHNAELVVGFLNEQKELFNSSAQGVYVFLDDDNRACNAKFAELLGYESAEEWTKVDVKESFPNVFVHEKSQQSLVEAYQRAMEKKVGSTAEITWKKKNGEAVDTTVILVPVAYQGHLFALHFVSLP